MTPLDGTYWVPAPVTAYIPHPIEINQEDFSQQQFAQGYDISDMYDNNEEFFRYASYEDYIDCYVWPDYLPFDTFNYLDEVQILEGENIFGNLFGDPILDMENFILDFPFLKMKTFLGICLEIIFFWMVGMMIGMLILNWNQIHMGFTVFCLAMGSSHPKKSMMQSLDHFLQTS